MKRIYIGLLLVIGVGGGNALLGCGAKFVNVARSTRQQQAPVGRQENILIYMNPASDVSAALARVSAEVALRREGYRPKIVDTYAGFQNELLTSKWDLVVVGVQDVEDAKIQTNGTKILLVAMKMAKKDVDQAKKQVAEVLTKPSSDSKSLVRAIQAALRS